MNAYMQGSQNCIQGSQNCDFNLNRQIKSNELLKLN